MCLFLLYITETSFGNYTQTCNILGQVIMTYLVKNIQVLSLIQFFFISRSTLK